MTKTIGSFAKNLILTTEMSNTEILEAVRNEFENAKTSMACIAWYKSDLRKKGLLESKRAPKLTTEEKIAKLKEELEALEATLEVTEE
jgi:hypothetical protein